MQAGVGDNERKEEFMCLKSWPGGGATIKVNSLESCNLAGIIYKNLGAMMHLVTDWPWACLHHAERVTCLLVYNLISEHLFIKLTQHDACLPQISGFKFIHFHSFVQQQGAAGCP